MMNYLRRRFSDPNAMTGLPDGYFQNIGQEEVVEKRTAISTSNSPTMPRRDNSMGFLSSLAPRQEKGNQKTLLVIDDLHTDWAKYFRGKLIHGEYEIRVEQCEFSELNLASYSDAGVTVDMRGIRQGQRVVRTFKPDYVLVRQHARSMEVQEDWRNLVIGFQYGNVPSLNSWQVVYNFMDKPWVFSQLTTRQEKLGKEKFPLVDQAFFPNHREMVSDDTVMEERYI
ncbi:synapsin-3 [Strongylocentrotus purpuratus]|uniref:Synapsin n=1 Tax=Strongylocentrotus purpuratus TaxID=7668 RepID=A0A7M7PVN0_STRPU|nr:synapsin-3 [Strongylocentrotus purpuratus]